MGIYATAIRRVRFVLDLLVTLLVAASAIVLLWRSTATRTSIDPPGPSTPVENVEKSKLKTDIADAIVRGDENASVVMIEYSDFQCPFCAKFARETFERINQEFVAPGLVQYAFRNYPIENIHRSAIAAAKAAECASQHRRFWEMRERLFAEQANLDKIQWGELATHVGVEKEVFAQCLASKATEDKVDQQKRHGATLGVSSTPTFLIGRRDVGGSVQIVSRILGAHPPEVFERVLDDALRSVGTKRPNGASSDKLPQRSTQ